MDIGKLKLSTAAPADLEAQLHASTGCTADEVRAIVAATPLASQVAQALHPFLNKDAPSIPELSVAIAAEGIDTIRVQVLDLYAKQEAKQPDTTNE